MEQPPRFVAQGEDGKFFRLHKSLYGLNIALMHGLENSAK